MERTGTHGRITSGSTKPLWFDTRVRQTPVLAQDAYADICVIGAGIAGLSVAYHLAAAGKRVIVVDDGRIASGETGRTTAHLTSALDDRYFVLEQMHGRKNTKLAAESHQAAIEEIARIVGKEKIACDFERVDGFLFMPAYDGKLLNRELAAARRAGLKQVEKVERAPLPFDTGACLKFPQQGMFHIIKYMNGLAQAILRDGGQMYQETHIAEVHDAKNGMFARAVTTEGHVISAQDIVVATNTPVNDWMRIHTKQAPSRTYVIGARVKRGSVPHGLYWDGYWRNEDSYHYVRLQRAGADDILIVGGEDHKTGQRDDADIRYAALEKWTRERFPVASIAFRWSGQVMEPADHLGLIGKNPGDDHIYICTGDSGNGMTHGTIAGMLIKDLILERRNPWAKLYDPGRITLRAAPTFAKENLNVARQYTDWLTAGDADAEQNIPRGSGMVLREGMRKVACYRDEEGAVHKMSAVCTHMGCVVSWNSGEKSWDCPCHGSRFDPHGHVVNGPAIKDLQERAPEKLQTRASTAAASAKREKAIKRLNVKYPKR